MGQPALISTLLNNICDELKSELVMRELTDTLSEVMTLCVKVDEHIRARRRVGNYSSQRSLGRVEAASAEAEIAIGTRTATTNMSNPYKLDALKFPGKTSPSMEGR